jgi:glycosyltransferase involved in cell wall biosynthesis
MKNNTPLISIGMPVYNGDLYLEKAIDAILQQTFTDFELIISDNASSDRTSKICLNYADRDSRIRYYRNETNLGAAKNYNRVFELARGEYFKWAAHDDWCAPEYLEKCLEILQRESSIILCYTKAYLVKEQENNLSIYTEDDLNIRASKPHERLYKLLDTYGWNHVPQVFGLMRTDVLKKTLLIANYPHADRVLLAELALLGEFCELPDRLFYRRVHPTISQWANATDETLATWYDTKKKDKLIMAQWRRYSEYFHIIDRTELDWIEKVFCYVQLCRRLLLTPGLKTRIQGMTKELFKAFKKSEVGANGRCGRVS